MSVPSSPELSSPSFHSAKEYPSPAHGATSSETQPTCRVFQGKTLTFGSTTEKSITPMHVPFPIVNIHQRRTESTGSTESAGSTHPKYSHYKELYEQLSEKYRSKYQACCIRGFGFTGLKAHLVDRVEGYFEEFRDTPITLTGNPERLSCFIKTTLLIYCRYKERCLDQNNRCHNHFKEDFEKIDQLHLQLFFNIYKFLKEKDKTITDILREEILSATVIAESYSNIYPFYREKMPDLFKAYREDHQIFYPPFISELLGGTTSESQLFGRLKPQSSVESTGSSVHSGLVVIESTEDTPVFSDSDDD